jgi:hypothetical protein
MKKRTIGILATSVAVSALCIVTDVSAVAGGMAVGVEVAGMVAAVEEAAGMAVGVEAVAIKAVGVRFTAGLPGIMVGAVAGMAVGSMVAWPTWVMGGVAMHRALTAGLTHAEAKVITTLPIISVTIS